MGPCRAPKRRFWEWERFSGALQAPRFWGLWEEGFGGFARGFVEALQWPKKKVWGLDKDVLEPSEAPQRRFGRFWGLGRRFSTPAGPSKKVLRGCRKVSWGVVQGPAKQGLRI